MSKPIIDRAWLKKVIENNTSQAAAGLILAQVEREREQVAERVRGMIKKLDDFEVNQAH